MKRILFFGVVILTAVSTIGCACYSPGFGRSCGLSRACGPVDYVDGGPGACEANCGGSYATGCGSSHTSCGSSLGVTPCADCLVCIGNGIRVVGEGALAIAASPFIIARHVICAGCNGYGSYPNCGCSNEVYYGDNCYQAHDICDPCGCSPSPCTTTTGTSGCSHCNNNGYSEEIQPDSHSVPVDESKVSRRPSPIRPVSYSAQFSQPQRVKTGAGQTARPLQ